MKKIKLGKYQHYKGNFYKVIGVAKHSESLEDLIIYQALYESKEFGKDAIWVRPIKMFFEKIELNGKKIPRFKYVNEK